MTPIYIEDMLFIAHIPHYIHAEHILEKLIHLVSWYLDTKIIKYGSISK